nr:MAG TPA: hypothetical protein [Caudoviricetes sp.]
MRNPENTILSRKESAYAHMQPRSPAPPVVSFPHN